MNSLNQNIPEGTVVILSTRFKGTEEDRTFVCRSGFGLSDKTRGTAISGYFVKDGEECRVEGTDIESIAENQTVPEIKKMFITYESMKAEIMERLSDYDDKTGLCRMFYMVNKEFVSPYNSEANEEGFTYKVIPGISDDYFFGEEKTALRFSPSSVEAPGRKGTTTLLGTIG